MFNAVCRTEGTISKGSWAYGIRSIKASDLPKCRGDWESREFVRRVQSHTPKINPRRNYWCGPYAMAVLTNTSYEEGLTQVWKHDPTSRSIGMVRGVWNSTMQKALKTFFKCKRIANRQQIATGYNIWESEEWMDAVGNDKVPTLARWLKTRNRRTVYLINITGHYIVVAGDKWIDNNTKRWQSINVCKYRKKRVQNVFPIKPLGGK